MIKNHFKIAWRSLKKQPFFTFLNTLGLAVGMAGGLLIGLYIHDELNFDTMFADAERIYRIDADIKFGGAEIKASESASPMAAAIQNDISQVESTVRLRDQGSLLIKKEGSETNVKELSVAFADSTFFEMFGIDLLLGDAKTALTEPNTLVLTKKAAARHFNIEDALGQTMLLNNTTSYTVTGVIDDLPKNSLLRDHSVFMAMAGHPNSREDDWGSTNYFTFVKLLPGSRLEDFQVSLQGMFERYMLPWAQDYFPGITKESFEASGNYIRYKTMALTDIHLYSNRQSELSANSSIQNVYILSFIGLFLIVLASVNFMNLSTAQSLKRSKEVGVRKTLGSDRFQLIWQFLTEAGLISLLSLVLAFVLALVAMPLFNELSGKSMSIPFANPLFWMVIFLATILLGLFSGSYPAFFMSRFMPVKTLMGGMGTKVGGGTVRKILVTFQFTISILLIIGTLVVYQQLNFIQEKDLGFDKEQILLIDDTFAVGDKVQSFKEQVVKLSQVESATLSSFLPTPSARSNTSFFKEGAMDQENALQMQVWAVDRDYLSTLNIDLVDGRNFSEKLSADSTAMILNEAALEVLNISPNEALGLRISEDIENPVFRTVIGVMKDFHYESLREDIEPLCVYLGRSTGSMAVKLRAGDFRSAISDIELLWKEMAPGQPFNYQFMDDSFNATYIAEQRLGTIFMIFALLSIFIACLGLFGLAAFNAEKRTKEVGIRKVLGASVGQIIYRLTTDFVKMVVLAIIISVPAGWYIMNKWLENFSYRVSIDWWVLTIAALLALAVAIITVSYQSAKAASSNPVNSIRME